ncbi:MAG: hypothetical protein AB7I27_15745 [Bacteriovoracaceae bacterium]
MNMFKMALAASVVLVNSAFATPVLVGNEIQSESCEITVVEKVIRATVSKPTGGMCVRTINLPAKAIAEALTAKGYKVVVAKEASEVKSDLVVYGNVEGYYVPTAGHDDCLVHIKKSDLTVAHGAQVATTSKYTLRNDILVNNQVVDESNLTILKTVSSRNSYDVNALPNCVVK